MTTEDVTRARERAEELQRARRHPFYPRGTFDPQVEAVALDSLALCAEVEALRAQRDEAIRSAVAGWNPERR